MRSKTRKTWLLGLLLLVAAVGCQRRPLEVMYSTTVRVIVQVQWNIVINSEVTVDPELQKPTGVTLYIFRDGKFYNSVTTSNVDEIEVQLETGKYKMYMISQSPEEFWREEFVNMTDFDNAATRLRANTTATWASRKSGDEDVVENPEILFAGVSDEFEITEKMTEDFQYYYTTLTKLRRAAAAAAEEDKTKGDTKGGTKTDEEIYLEERVEYYTIRIPIEASNIVSQLYVSIYASNIDVLQSLRASTSGMARTFELTQGVTDDEEAIQIIREWKLVMDDESRRVGHLDGIITTFGLPNNETGSTDRDPSLNVSALLIDNATVADYEFMVGDRIHMLAPNPGYRHLFRLIFGSVDEPAMELPDVKPDPGTTGGGFTAGVEDWGEEEHVDLIL